MENSSNKFQILSPVFKDNGYIPVQYTCRGQNINPPLNFLGIPIEAKSLVLIMHDPDAINMDFVHWIMWNIPVSTESIAPNSVPAGAIQGKNGAGTNVYIGPCPPDGTGVHHYHFKLYALSEDISLDKEENRYKLDEVIKDKIIGQSVLIGLFSAQPKK